MQDGYIESVTVREAAQRKEFWSNQLKKQGLDREYRVIGHKVSGHGSGFIGLFVEEIPACGAEGKSEPKAGK